MLDFEHKCSLEARIHHPVGQAWDLFGKTG